MSKITRKEVFNNAIWRFLERFLAQLITTGVSVILARILLPDDYGAIAIIMIFINFCNILVSKGFNSSLIQKKDADDLDFSTVFYINIALTVVLYFTIFFTAPLISSFYKLPILTALLRVMALRIPFTAINSIQNAYVARNMQFKKYFFATLGGTVASGIIGVVMAWKGLGAWALVGQYLSSTVINSVILWIIVKWRPKWMFSINRAKSLFAYGWKILVSGLLDELNVEMTGFIIGKKYSSSDLAFYQKGKQFPTIINTNVGETITTIMFSVLSKEQQDRELIKRHMKKALKNICFVMFPLLLGMVAVSEDFLLLLLTEKWASAIPFMQIFCISCLFHPINSLNIQAIKATGESGKYLKTTVIKTIACISIIFCALMLDILLAHIGIVVLPGLIVALAGVLTAFVTTLIQSYPLKKLIGYSFWGEIKDIFLTLIISLVMMTAVLCVGFLNLPLILSLIIKILLGIGLYVLLARIFKHESLFYIWNLIKSNVRGRKK